MPDHITITLQRSVTNALVSTILNTPTKLRFARCECLAAFVLHRRPVTSIAAKLNRLMPLFLAMIRILALVQLFVYLGQWLSKMQVAAWLAEHATLIEWVLCLAAGVSLSLVVL